MKYSVQSANKHNDFQWVMDNLTREFTDEDDIKRIKKMMKIITKLTKRSVKCNLSVIKY